MATLPLSELKNATNSSSFSLKECSGLGGTPTTPIELSNFKVGNVVSITTDSNAIPYNSVFNANVVFTGEEYLFSRIKLNDFNFIETLNGSRLQLVSESGSTKTLRNVYNPGGRSGGSSVTENLLIKFYDQSYNEDANNYNVNLSKSLTLYTPPKPSLAFSSSTRPPRPCCGVSVGWGYPCCYATITFTYNSNPWQGVDSSSINFYISTNGTLGGLFATAYNSSGSQTISNLSGNTTYYITAINNYNCWSETLVVTTPTYL